LESFVDVKRVNIDLHRKSAGNLFFYFFLWTGCGWWPVLARRTDAEMRFTADSELKKKAWLNTHGMSMRQVGLIVGKVAESFWRVFSAVYGESGLGGACAVCDGAGSAGVFSSDMGVHRG
jgi:hypothetical protein